MKRACLMILMLAACAAQAGPSKEYSVQENVRCAYGMGCPRMRANAVSHARSWCSAEGGVKRGERRTDFRCQQRGIYCVVSGRVECNGRLDPRSAPGRPDGPAPAPAPPTRTCLDVSCDRFVGHGPGRREDGTYACPPQYALVGVSGRGGDVVCQRLDMDWGDSRLDHDTRRRAMRACPAGTLARGAGEERRSLLCARPATALGEEVVQDETGNLGLQVCEAREGRPHYLTGVDEARGAILCAPLRPPR